MLARDELYQIKESHKLIVRVSSPIFVIAAMALLLWLLAKPAAPAESPLSDKSHAIEQARGTSQSDYDQAVRENKNALTRWEIEFAQYKNGLRSKEDLWKTLFSTKWIFAVTGTLMAIISTYISVNRTTRNEQSIRKIDSTLMESQNRIRGLSEALQTWRPNVTAVVQFLAVAPLSGKLSTVEAEAQAARILLDSIVQIRRAQLGQPVSDREPSTDEKKEAIAYLGAKNAIDLMQEGESVLLPQVQALRDKLERETLRASQMKESLMRNSYIQRNIAAGFQILGTIILLAKDLF
jgi:hypothetical protein